MLTWFSSLNSPMATSPQGVRCGSILARMNAPHVLMATVEGGRLTDHDRRSLPVPWWSLTKTAIASAALVLVGGGRLALGEPLDSRPYTLRQLLQHTAGVPEYGAPARRGAGRQRPGAGAPRRSTADLAGSPPRGRQPGPRIPAHPPCAAGAGATYRGGSRAARRARAGRPRRGRAPRRRWPSWSGSTRVREASDGHGP